MFCEKLGLLAGVAAAGSSREAPCSVDTVLLEVSCSTARQHSVSPICRVRWLSRLLFVVLKTANSI